MSFLGKVIVLNVLNGDILGILFNTFTQEK